jgi:hypothetical protein
MFFSSIQPFISNPAIVVFIGFLAGLLLTRLIYDTKLKYYKKELRDVEEELNGTSRADVKFREDNVVPFNRLISDR